MSLTFHTPTSHLAEGYKSWESQTNYEGNQSVGVFRLPNVYADYFLYEAPEFQVCAAGEKVFRFETEKARIAQISPLIKINMTTGALHFLNPDLIMEDEIVFEGRSVKPLFININSNQK